MRYTNWRILYFTRCPRLEWNMADLRCGEGIWPRGGASGGVSFGIISSHARRVRFGLGGRCANQQRPIIVNVVAVELVSSVVGAFTGAAVVQLERYTGLHIISQPVAFLPLKRGAICGPTLMWRSKGELFSDLVYPPTAYTGRFLVLAVTFLRSASHHKLITSFTQTKVVTTTSRPS